METARPVEVPPKTEAPQPQSLPQRDAPSTPPVTRPALKKHPAVAFLLAAFPGMGNIYNGLYLRGAVFFAIVASLMAIGADEGENHPVLGFVIAFVWLFNIIDSVRQAQLINCGYAQDLGLSDLPTAPKAGQGGLIAGILMLVLGVVASLQLYFDVDLSWMIKFWPLGLMGIGAWLIVAWARERRKDQPQEGSLLL